MPLRDPVAEVRLLSHYRARHLQPFPVFFLLRTVNKVTKTGDCSHCVDAVAIRSISAVWRA